MMKQIGVVLAVLFLLAIPCTAEENFKNLVGPVRIGEVENARTKYRTLSRFRYQ